MSVGSKVNYYGYDGRGNVSELMNAIGGVNMSYSYGAFGKTSTKVTTYTRNSYTYNGENVDLIPGVPDLQYLRARYYDPNMGRFMQQDTLFGEMERPLTQNLYIYCLNNGVNLRDPSGNRSVDSIKADVNRYKDQLASAKSAGAGQSVYDGIQKTIDSLIKELGNELSKPKPNSPTKPPKPKPPTKPTPPKSDGGSLTPQDISELLDEGSIIGGCLDEFERAGNLDDNQKQIYEALKKRQDEIFKLMEGFVKANPNLSEKDWNKIYFPATQMTDAELLDKLQTAFDVAGVIPILGEGFDFTNGIISAIRGDWVMAGLSIGSMIPIAGDIAGKGGKAAIKYGDNVVDAIKGAGKIGKRDALLNSVKNAKLANAIDSIYRPGAKIGDGGLGDAVRHELTTGQLVGGKSHIQKAMERIKNLENIINTQNLSSGDLKIANDILSDLRNAMGV